VGFKLALADEAGRGFQRTLVEDPPPNDAVERRRHDFRVARRLTLPDEVEFVKVHLTGRPVAQPADALLIRVQFRPVLTDGTGAKPLELGREALNSDFDLAPLLFGLGLPLVTLAASEASSILPDLNPRCCAI